MDGADEIDPKLNLIKGLGGALLREKVVGEFEKSGIPVRLRPLPCPEGSARNVRLASQMT